MAHTPQQVKNLYDLLAAQLRADLLTDEEYHRRRRELNNLAHQSLREVAGERHKPETCFFCQEEEMNAAVLMRPEVKSERAGHFRI